MNIRPRCREWLPLSTQQLRLRNLQAIQAVNLEHQFHADDSCSSASCPCTETLLYYTLHDHPENEAFYESEKLPLRMHLPLKWAEIQCLSIVKSNANCVCIKIWIWTNKTEQSKLHQLVKKKLELIPSKETKEPISALTCEFAKSRKPTPMPPDKLLFTWGVYFSGLIPLSQNSEVKCSSNSLIFQMNDELFASPEHFSTENLREQLALNYERYSASVPKCSIPTPDEFTINSPHVSRSSSPTAVDWQRDLMRMSKTRYSQLNCVRTEVRISYSLTKLLRLQQLQRQRLQTQRDSVELTAEIMRLSLRCITKEQLLRKPRTTSMSSSSTSSTSATATQYHSMGRKLSLLLAEQQRVEPHQLLHAQQLQKQLESYSSKQRLLQNAHDTFSKRINYLRQQLNAAAIARQQLQTWLAARRRQLQEDKADLEDMCVSQLERRQRKRSVMQHLERRISSLCIELKEIYPIARSHQGFYTICGVAVHSVEGCVYDSYNPNSVYIPDNITPMALSASLGYVAHLVEMISVVLNRPLMNPIIPEGSHTRIMDIIKNIPPNISREFPLYSRSSIPTKAEKYAVNLLNQNIAQLYYDITGIRCHRRDTIENILHIFEVFVEIEQNKREIHSHNMRTLHRKRLTINELNSTKSDIDGTNHHEHFNPASIKNGKDYVSLSKSHSSVDMDHMPPPSNLHHHADSLQHGSEYPLTSENLRLSSQLSSQPINLQQERELKQNNQQRICRSVGSYTDSEDERDCHSSSVKVGFSNSDSNLTLQSGHI